MFTKQTTAFRSQIPFFYATRTIFRIVSILSVRQQMFLLKWLNRTKPADMKEAFIKPLAKGGATVLN